MDALLPGFFQEAEKCSFAGSEHKLEAALILVWVVVVHIKGDALHLDSETEKRMQASHDERTSSSKETN